MVTLIILLTIISIVCIIKSQNTKDKRDPSADQQIQQLPPIHFHSLKNSTGKKLLSLEFFETNDAILEDFNFNNGYLKMTMRNGHRVSGPLNLMGVRFEKVSGFIVISAADSQGNQVQFTKLDNFTANQWDTIISVLMLAGTTYGNYIFGSFYKNANKAALVMRILSKL